MVKNSMIFFFFRCETKDLGVAFPPWQLGTSPRTVAIFSSEGLHRQRESDEGQDTGLSEVIWFFLFCLFW